MSCQIFFILNEHPFFYGCRVSYSSTNCSSDFTGLPLPVRIYEDIGFGRVDLSKEGLRPLDPSKTEKDIETFVAQKMQDLKPVVQIVSKMIKQ